MTRPTVIAAAVLGVSVVAGCATTRIAAAEQVRESKDGGTILLHPGTGPQAAVRYALASMESHCEGQYEIVEAAKMGTGQEVFAGSSSYGSWAGSSATIYGMSLTYLCRKPVDTSLNNKFATFASQDLLGRRCGSARDCGVYFCTVSKAPTSGSICTAADGSIPFALEGEACDQKPCIAPFVCYKTYRHGSDTACKIP